MRAAVRSLPEEHAAALLAVAVLYIHQRPGGNAKLCVVAKELLLAHGAAFGHIEGMASAFMLLGLMADLLANCCRSGSGDSMHAYSCSYGLYPQAKSSSWLTSTVCFAGARSAVSMLQESIAARSAAQPLLLSLAGRLELATAQLPRPVPGGSDSAAARADGLTAADHAVASGFASSEDEPLAADALADGVDVHSDGSDDEEEGDEEALTVATDESSASDGSDDIERDGSDLDR